MSNSPETPVSHSTPPQTIGPYTVHGAIGKGGMGEVFLGHDERLDRPVALKRMRPSQNSSKEGRERFRREARALARIRHPLVVEVYDWIEGDEEDWLVMELLEGRSLRSEIESGSFDLRKALEIGRDIAAGLTAVHVHGIVHRDLKPDNVMVLRDEESDPGSYRIKLLDFGLAKRVESMDGLTLTETISKAGQILGTVRYMSPEQASGGHLDGRSDIFSLGALLYEMLTGVSPFNGENSVETLTRICTVVEVPAHQIQPEIPDALSKFVSRMLKKTPEMRPQDAAQVAEHLGRIASAMAAGRASDEFRAALASVESVTEGLTHVLPRAATDETAIVSATESGSYVRTLLLSDLVESTQLVEKLGDERAAAVFQNHDRVARDLLKQTGGREIDKSDGFLMLFERPIDAVRYALGYHRSLRELSEQEGLTIASRVGIHVGEVVLRANMPEDVARGAKPLEVEGLAKATAARFMSLAGPGQTLTSRGVFELARRATVGADDLPADLQWMEHGRYALKGVEEPAGVFEVGVKGKAPFSAPKNTAKAKRAGTRFARRLGVIACGISALALVALLVWWSNRPTPLDIAVLKPVAGSVDESVNGQLVAGAIRGALERRLTTLRGISVTPRMQIDNLQGSTLQVAKSLAVDEVVTAEFDCAKLICQITLSRVSSEGGDIVWGGSFASRADDLLQLHNAVEQNFRRGFAERKVQSGEADLEVSAKDYNSYLRLVSESLDRTTERPPADLLADLKQIQASSPRFLYAYLLETAVLAHRYWDERDENTKQLILSAYDKARDLAPENPLPLFGLAEFAQDAGDLEVLESTVESLKLIAGGHPRVQGIEAVLLERRGEPKPALALMRKAAEIQPSFHLMRYLAMMEYRQGNSVEARALLEAILEMQPDDFIIRHYLANVELLSGEPTRAVELFEELADRSPEVDVLSNLGVAHMLLGQWEQANEAFVLAVQKAPDSPGLLLNLSDTEMLLGRTESALNRYREITEAIEANPSIVGGVEWQGLTVKGQALARLGETSRAVLAAQEALRIAPDNPQVALEAATIYALAGETISAGVNARRALEAGVDPRWFSFPWFQNIQGYQDFRALVENSSNSP